MSFQEKFFTRIFRGEMVIWIILLFFFLISIIEVYSSSSYLVYKDNLDYWQPFKGHVIYYVIGWGIVLISHVINPKFFKLFVVLLPISWILLILLRFPKLDLGFMSVVTINDAARWIRLFGIQFQPSELAKLGLIVTMALLLSKKNDNNEKRIFWWMIGLSLVTCGLIVQESGSTASLLFFVILLMLLVGQVMKKYLYPALIICGVGGAIFITALFMIPENSLNKSVLPLGAYWQKKIKTFYGMDINDPNFKITDDNRQNINLQIAIASGGRQFPLGKLPGNSVHHDSLTFSYSDTMFARIVEELGLVGGLFVLFLYIILFVRTGIIADRSETPFSRYLVLGSSFLILAYALTHICVSVGLIPITGQPLPLISMGGTSIMTTCLYIGMILSVSRHETKKGIEQEENIEEQFQMEKLEENEEET